MSLVTVLKCMPAGDPSGFTGSEDPGAGCVVRSVASAGRGEDRPGSGSGHGWKAPGLQGRPFLGAQGQDLAPRAAPGPLWAAHSRARGP